MHASETGAVSGGQRIGLRAAGDVPVVVGTEPGCGYRLHHAPVRDRCSISCLPDSPDLSWELCFTRGGARDARLRRTPEMAGFCAFSPAKRPRATGPALLDFGNVGGRTDRPMPSHRSAPSPGALPEFGAAQRMVDGERLSRDHIVGVALAPGRHTDWSAESGACAGIGQVGKYIEATRRPGPEPGDRLQAGRRPPAENIDANSELGHRDDR